jgi:hypothetical protein
LWAAGLYFHEGAGAFNVGDRVRVVRVPERLGGGEGDSLNTRRIFELCVGHTFPIVGLANGLIELEVGKVVGEPAYMHSIWIEPDCVEFM